MKQGKHQENRSSIVYIDPDNCGSTVGYRIDRKYRTVNASVTLSDCSRQISWEFYVYGNRADDVERQIAEAERKIAMAVGMLEAFRLQMHGIVDRARKSPKPPKRR